VAFFFFFLEKEIGGGTTRKKKKKINRKVKMVPFKFDVDPLSSFPR
jgi:hypothetical protein